MVSVIVKEIVGARDLAGPLKWYRWLAACYSQDHDILFTAFLEPAIQLSVTLDRAEREELIGQLEVIIIELASTLETEDERVERYWVKLGGEYWPDDLPLQIGLSQIKEVLETANKSGK